MVKLELRFQNIALKGFNLRDGDTLTIGRDATNDIVIDNSTISRLHACIVLKGDDLTVCDEGSKGGIFVNEEKLESAQLKNGDVVRFDANHNLKVFITAKKTEPTMTCVHQPK